MSARVIRNYRHLNTSELWTAYDHSNDAWNTMRKVEQMLEGDVLDPDTREYVNAVFRALGNLNGHLRERMRES